jgi:hypothetical protein
VPFVQLERVRELLLVLPGLRLLVREATMKTMPTPKPRKLALARETVRNLTLDELARAAGGRMDDETLFCPTMWHTCVCTPR